MSVNWLWKNKMGTIKCKNKGILNVYKGNCLCVLIYEWKENKKEKYMFNNFFNDIEHFKKCIGLKKNFDNKLEDIFKETWVKWKLNTYFKESLKIAELLTQAGYKVELYYKEIK